MIRLMTALAASIALLCSHALADEVRLSHAQGPADGFESIEEHAHSISFNPADPEVMFVESIRFFGHRYGDVGDLMGSIVIYGAQTEKSKQVVDIPDTQVIYANGFFNLSDVPETPGWVEVPFEIDALPKDGFTVSIYTYSNADRGVKLGLSSSNGTGYSSSYESWPVVVTTKMLEKQKNRKRRLSQVEQREEDGIRLRTDGREWLVECIANHSSGLGSEIALADISGRNIDYYDDGSAESYEEFTDYAGLVRFDNSRRRTVDAIYVYGKVEGEFFDTDRNVTVMLLNHDTNIIKRMTIPYTAFSEEGSWARLDVPDTAVTRGYYVFVDPRSEARVKFLLGVDHSGNKGSIFGGTGAIREWDAVAPEDKANWMVRVHYKR